MCPQSQAVTCLSPARKIFSNWVMCWSASQAAFTRVELLAVLIMLTLLALMLLPALARTKSDSRGLRCLNNNRELNRAWRMWTDDNNDLLLFSSHNGIPSDPNNQRAWVISELDFSPSPKNWDPAVSITPSPMWPYCGTNANIWRCPSDESYVLVNGSPKPRVRSFSMNFYLGGFAGSSGGAPFSAYRLYLKSSEIIHPTPERLFVFLDMRSDSINWGNFVTSMDGYPNNPAAFKFNDLPGAYHDGAATFTYADGHGEIHRWQDARTTPPLVLNGPINYDIPAPRNPDIAWLQDRATRPK